jgi:hypothetical protein
MRLPQKSESSKQGRLTARVHKNVDVDLRDFAVQTPRTGPLRCRPWLLANFLLAPVPAPVPVEFPKFLAKSDNRHFGEHVDASTERCVFLNLN